MQVDDALLQRERGGILEEREELLELVEDDDRPVVGAARPQALLERLRREHDLRRRVVGSRQERGQVVAAVAVLVGRDALDDDLLARPRLHAHALEREPEPEPDDLRQQAGVDERRLAVAGVAVEHDAAVDGDEAGEAVGLLLAGEEDRVVDVAKRPDPAVGDGGDRDVAGARDRYGASSSPVTFS